MPVTRHKSLNPALIRFKAGLGKRNEPEKKPATKVKEPDELLIAVQEAVLKGEVTSEGKPSTRALSERYWAGPSRPRSGTRLSRTTRPGPTSTPASGARCSDSNSRAVRRSRPSG